MRLLLAAILTTCTAVAEETVRGVMQAMPGDELALIDAGVRPTPDNLPFLPANAVKLRDRDLVLGIEHGGESWALPIRFLGLWEVLNLSLGELPVAATW